MTQDIFTIRVAGGLALAVIIFTVTMCSAVGQNLHPDEHPSYNPGYYQQPGPDYNHGYSDSYTKQPDSLVGNGYDKQPATQGLPGPSHPAAPDPLIPHPR
jgi:hypothetical protein